MKKYLLLMLLAFVVAGGYAQKGRQAVGVQTGIMGFLDYYEACGGAELLYQYSFADAWRVEAALGGYRSEDARMVGNTSELQFLIGKRRIRPMILAGINLGYSEFHDYDYTYDYGESGFNFGGFGGIGFDCRLSYSWSLMGKFFVGGAMVCGEGYLGGKIGVTYNF